MLNKDAYIPMNAEIHKKISHNFPKLIAYFRVQLDSSQEQKNAMIKFMESEDIEKFNIGNIEFLFLILPFYSKDFMIEKKRNLKNERNLYNGNMGKISNTSIRYEDKSFLIIVINIYLC